MVTQDVMVEDYRATSGRCPRCGGLVVGAEGLVLADGKCVNCCWLRYTAKGYETVQRSLVQVQREMRGHADGEVESEVDMSEGSYLDEDI